jgi:two-component system response regulator CpxR
MRQKILVVDDDKEMCEELADILEGEGYQVTFAFDGLQGKSCLESRDFDAVLMDLKMPKLNGLEVLKWAKESGRKAKILILTGSPTKKDVDDGEILPLNLEKDEKRKILDLADEFLNKPYQVEALIKKLKEVLG